MHKFSFHGFVSLLLSFAFVVIVVSGLILWLAKPPSDLSGPWLIFGMTKGAWKHLHIWVGLTMLVVGEIHLVLNWSIYWCYLWNRSTRRPHMLGETILALVVVALIVVWGICDHPRGGSPDGDPHGSHGVQQQNRYRGGQHE
jgi:hypothetical protein